MIIAKSLVCAVLIIALLAIGCAGPGAAPKPTSSPAPTPTATKAPEVILDEIAEATAKIRGLLPITRINHQFLTEEELDAWLDESYHTSNSVEEIRISKEVLVILDLLEPDYDLYNNLLELYKEQVAGLYDPETGEMIILGDLQEIGPIERVAFSHEYVHALQDQHFDLESLPLEEEHNSDLAMAVLSLVEGDATLAMSEYAAQHLSFLELLGLAIGEDTGGYESAPRVIRETLIFPYMDGVEFVSALFGQGGWKAINDAYLNLPQSTEQILHPDKYIAGEQPQEVVMPDLQEALGDEWSQLYSDVMGELDMRMYLETFVDKSTAAAAAEGWGGAQYVFWENPEGQDLLVLLSAWDTTNDAGEFFEAYVEFVDNKSGGVWTARLDDEARKWWSTQDTSVYLSKEESEVLLIIAPDDITVNDIITCFPSL